MADTRHGRHGSASGFEAPRADHGTVSVAARYDGPKIDKLPVSAEDLAVKITAR